MKQFLSNTLTLWLIAFSDTALGQNNENPFAPFLGEWTLKNDTFQQVWDRKTVETLIIENHHTRCEAINTTKSVLCVVTAGDLEGHIFWTYDSAKKKVHHLSHFGESRNGVGMGELDQKSNLFTTVAFQGEPEGSYRKYRYTWVSKNEYHMISEQFDKTGGLTGNWYGGTFVRLK